MHRICTIPSFWMRYSASMFDALQVSTDFSTAAPQYDANASLQREVLIALAGHCADLTPGSHVLDAGCGTGRLAHLLAGHRVTQADLALGMCRVASANNQPTVNATLQSLPFAGGTFDAVVCSLVLQWLPDWKHALQELRRVVRPGGLLAVSTFGPATLRELAESFAAVDDAPHISAFPSRESFGTSEIVTHYYPNLSALMRQLKAIGARNKHHARRRAVMTPRQLARVEHQYASRFGGSCGLPATWEILTQVERA